MGKRSAFPLILFSCNGPVRALRSRGPGRTPFPASPGWEGLSGSSLSPRSSSPTSIPLPTRPIIVLEQLYDGLVRLDSNYNVMPSLAEYWVISGDGRKFTFTLRKGAKFHHGREVTADDVKFSLETTAPERTSGRCTIQYFITKVVGAEEFLEREGRGGRRLQGPRPLHFRDRLEEPLCLRALPPEHVLLQGPAPRPGRVPGPRLFREAVGDGGFQVRLLAERYPSSRSSASVWKGTTIISARLPYLDAVEYSPFFTVEQFMEGRSTIIPLRIG